MPKKRTYNFKQLQGASSSSAANGRVGSGKNVSVISGESTSVNERLEELRLVGGSEAAQVKRDLADWVNVRTVPPQLRGILGVPESAPPKPKVHRPYRGLRAQGTVAGPPFPQSWLRPDPAGLPSLALRRRIRNPHSSTADVKDRERPPQAWRFARVTGFVPNTEPVVGSRSLLHLCCKTAAQEWESFDEIDYPALIDLDLRLRIRLLSYIGYYGPSLGHKGFEALVQGQDPVRLLDLAGLLGHGTFTSGRLVKSSKARTAEAPKQNQVVESWEEEEDSLEAALNAGLSVSRFSHLTHLCLSHPASSVSWKDLLSLSKQVPKVTHLSLAYWPWPTLTPNLASTAVSSGRSPDVVAGGSHFYSELDRDYAEPASLLRQLSLNLLCLRWLDLEGCAGWMGALTKHASVDPTATMMETPDAWRQTIGFVNIFLNHWKNVTYMNCYQGWLPSKSGMDDLPRQTMNTWQRNVTLDFLKLDKNDTELSGEQLEHPDSKYLSKRKAEIWLETETSATKHGSLINELRRKNELKPILIDHGWRERYI